MLADQDPDESSPHLRPRDRESPGRIRLLARVKHAQVDSLPPKLNYPKSDSTRGVDDLTPHRVSFGPDLGTIDIKCAATRHRYNSYSDYSCYGPLFYLNMATHDLTTAIGLEKYLESTPYASASIETVSGGHTGFMYRVFLKEPIKETGEKTVVIKHSLEFPAGSFGAKIEIVLSAERMDFEHEALKLVASTSGLSTVVGVPHVHAYDPHTHTLIMSDVAPCQLLSTALKEGDDEAVVRIGHALGEFMGRFHKWSSLPEQASVRKRFLENKISGDDVLGIRWQLTLSAAKTYNLEREWMQGMFREQMEDAKLGGPVVCMADFWFDNILVSTTGDLRIYIVDWETARTARPEHDLAQFATAAFTLEHVHKRMPLMREFFKAYKVHMELDESYMATYAGRDMLSFGVVMPWIRHRDESVKQPIAQLGLELLEAVQTGDKQALRKNPVLADM
ncbi:kinase-like domain-containing protein [Rhizoctonia solani]|nr:kinase-like domain-containing protein [Rhizoctonia solani]